jgi:hypothetical protein
VTRPGDPPYPETMRRDRLRPWLAGALLFTWWLTSATAAAQLHDPIRTPNGIVLGPASGNAAAPSSSTETREPRWITSEGHAVVRDAVSGALRCRDVSVPENMGTPTGVRLDPTDGTWFSTVAATGLADAVYVLSIHFPAKDRARLVRSSCSGGPATVADVAIDPLHLPSLTAISNTRALPAIGTRAVLVPTAEGIVRIDFEGSPGSRLWLPMSMLEAMLAGPLEDALGRPREGGTWSVQAGAASPDGRSFFVLALDAGSTPARALVEVSAEGALSLRIGPEPLGVTFLDETSDLVVDGGGAQLAFFPARRDGGPSFLGVLPLAAGAPYASNLVPAWPYWPDHDLGPSSVEFLVGSTSGTPYARLADGRVRAISFDDDLADFDRDGLTRGEESARGTSDHDRDVDRDGASDGFEVETSRTDPLRADDTPPTSTSVRGFAPSALINDWGRPFRWGAGELAAGGAAYCTGTEDSFEVLRDWRCWGADGAELTVAPTWSRPVFTDDLGHYFHVADGGRILRVERATGREELLATWTEPGMVGEQVVRVERAFSPDAILVARVLDGGLHLLAADGSDHALFEPSRVECPLTPTPADLARCGDADLARPVEEVALLGDDTTTGDTVAWVRLRGIPGGEIVQLTPTGLRHLTDSDALAPYTTYFRGVGRAPDGRWLVSSGDVGLEARVFDGAFRHLPVRQVAAIGQLEQFFGDGVGVEGAWAYLSLPPQTGETGGCSCVGSICLCGFDSSRAPPTPRIVPAVDRTLMVPVPDGLEPGEVVMTARGPGRDAASYPFEGRGLFRITTLGGVAPWLDEDDLARLGDEALRASLAETPLANLDDVGISPRLDAVCVVEPEHGRAIEITLDETSHLETSARLVATDAVGCAYDDEGRLALLRGRAIDVGGESIALDGSAPPRTLEHAAGRYLVLDEDGALECVDGALAHARPDVRLLTLSPIDVDGVVALIEREGSGRLARVEDLCSGLGASDALSIDGTFTLVDQLTAVTSAIRYEARGATIAIAPNGLLYGALWAPVAGSGELLDPMLNINQGITFALHRFRPAYPPITPERRIEAIDPWRLATDPWPIARVHSPIGSPRTAGAVFPSEVRALSLVRGGGIVEPWERRGLAPYEAWTAPPPSPDAGVAGLDAGRVEMPPTASGCTCRSGRRSESSRLAALALVAIAAHGGRRRARRRSNEAHERRPPFYAPPP